MSTQEKIWCPRCGWRKPSGFYWKGQERHCLKCERADRDARKKAVEAAANARKDTCDCGKKKEKLEAPTCTTCQLRDGSNAAEAEVIGALRLLGGGGTLAELVEETGYVDRHLYRALGALVEKGRVGKRVDEDIREDSMSVYYYFLKEAKGV